MLWSVEYGADRPAPAGISSTDPVMHITEPRQYCCEPAPEPLAHRLLESVAVARDASARTVNERARTFVRLLVDLVSQFRALMGDLAEFVSVGAGMLIGSGK